MSNETFVVINNIELGEGAELINSLTDIARCAKNFVEDCSQLVSWPSHQSTNPVGRLSQIAGRSINYPKSVATYGPSFLILTLLPRKKERVFLRRA